MIHVYDFEHAGDPLQAGGKMVCRHCGRTCAGEMTAMTIMQNQAARREMAVFGGSMATACVLAILGFAGLFRLLGV